MQSDITISKIRQLYGLIFTWHKENGHVTIERIIQSNQLWKRGNDNLEEYRQALVMPPPEDASLADMHLVARKVRMGVLEWNYQARSTDGLLLGDVAGSIMALYADIRAKEEAEQFKDSFYFVMDYYVQSDYEYFEKAGEVYQGELLDNDRNIGGRVALADTNWEMQKSSNDKRRLFFRKPTGLNLKVIETDEDNLFQLVSDGKISITTIEVR